MKVAWFTPLSTRSAIGEFSPHVTPALAEHCSSTSGSATTTSIGRPSCAPSCLTTTRPASPPGALRPRRLQHREQRRVPRRDLRGLELRPGIVVLHDRSYQHLFAEHWAGRRPGAVPRADGGAVRPTMGRARTEAAARRRPDLGVGPGRAALPAGRGGARRRARRRRPLGRPCERVRARWFGPVGELFLPAYRRRTTPRPRGRRRPHDAAHARPRQPQQAGPPGARDPRATPSSPRVSTTSSSGPGSRRPTAVSSCGTRRNRSRRRLVPRLPARRRRRPTARRGRHLRQPALPAARGQLRVADAAARDREGRARLRRRRFSRGAGRRDREGPARRRRRARARAPEPG